MKGLLKYILFTISMLLFSCSQEGIEIQQNGGLSTCQLIFDASMIGFDGESGTRVSSDEIWEDGSIVYLSFVVGANRVNGKAVYDKHEDTWTLYYDGIINNGTSSTCNAYYFENNQRENNSMIRISTDGVVYKDASASYSKTQGGMIINANLSPLTGRIRFKGIEGMEFSVSKVNLYDAFDVDDCELRSNGNPINLKVQKDGFTPYIYPFFTSTSRKLVISYDKYSFSTECEHPILDAGLSGFMEIPTEEKHNGWSMIKMSLPSVSTVFVSNIGISKASLSSAVVDDGNGVVSDCGFCYSTSANPTMADACVSYGAASGNFGKTITGLAENTTYHVRAYAVNELGVAYSADVTFTTQKVTVAKLSEVTIENLNNTSANFKATIISLGNGTLQDAGFVYSQNQFPTLDDNKLSCGNSSSLEKSVLGLSPETKYYVRAYAINEKGISYGEELSFTTPKMIVNPYTTITVETSYGSVLFDMAKVEGGTFTMGAQSVSSSQSNYDKDAYSDESPIHEVTLSTFYIGKTEVTQKLWYVVMGTYPSISNTYGRGDDYPVYNVSYTQCEQFISKLNSLTKKTFRMPTEAEWEYAARGGNNSEKSKYSGNNTVGSVAWYKNNSNNKSHSVAQKEANEVQVYDMSGNVWEWCSDWYGNYSMSDQTNPTGASSGPGRVIRGGGYNDAATECRVSVRSHASSTSMFNMLGFRLVME